PEGEELHGGFLSAPNDEALARMQRKRNPGPAGVAITVYPGLRRAASGLRGDLKRDGAATLPWRGRVVSHRAERCDTGCVTVCRWKRCPSGEITHPGSHSAALHASRPSPSRGG